jgi:hypothetical protein
VTRTSHSSSTWVWKAHMRTSCPGTWVGTGQPTRASAVSVPDFFRNGDYLLGPYWASVSTFLLRTSPPMTLSSACATAATQTNPVKIVEMGLRNEKTIMPPEVKVRAH